MFASSTPVDFKQQGLEGNFQHSDCLYWQSRHWRHLALTGTPWYRLTEPRTQALVYDILPPSTAITDYDIGLKTVS